MEPKWSQKGVKKEVKLSPEVARAFQNPPRDGVSDYFPAAEIPSKIYQYGSKMNSKRSVKTTTTTAIQTTATPATTTAAIQTTTTAATTTAAIQTTTTAATTTAGIQTTTAATTTAAI